MGRNSNLLVTARGPGQTLLGGDQIKVNARHVRGSDVRVGIGAAKRVSAIGQQLLTDERTNRGRRMEEVMLNSFYSRPSPRR